MLMLAVFTVADILLHGTRLFTLAAKLIRDGRDEATQEEMDAATKRMDDADDRLERVLREAEGEE